MKIFGIFLALVFLASANAQFGGGFGGAPEAAPVKSDLPYIRCGVCEALAKHAFRQVKAVKDALKPRKKVSVSLRRSFVTSKSEGTDVCTAGADSIPFLRWWL